MSPAATVLVVNDHPVVRRGLAAMLGLEDWVGRVVEAGSVRDGASVGATDRADVAVVDLGLPDGDGVELVRRLRQAPGCPVLVLTMTRDVGVVRACLAAGAGGYLLKDSPPDAVVRAARTVFDGGLVLGPEVAGAALPTARPARLPAPLDRLAPADLRLLALLAEGRTNPRIAAELGVAEAGEAAQRRQRAVQPGPLGLEQLLHRHARDLPLGRRVAQGPQQRPEPFQTGAAGVRGQGVVVAGRDLLVEQHDDGAAQLGSGRPPLLRALLHGGPPSSRAAHPGQGPARRNLLGTNAALQQPGSRSDRRVGNRAAAT